MPPVQRIRTGDRIEGGEGWGAYRRELRKIIEVSGKGNVKKAKGLDGLIEEV